MGTHTDLAVKVKCRGVITTLNHNVTNTCVGIGDKLLLTLKLKYTLRPSYPSVG